MSSGGGGPSGKVSWPAYMMNFHSQILSKQFSGDSEAANPLPSESFYKIYNDALADNPFVDMLVDGYYNAGPDTQLIITEALKKTTDGGKSLVPWLRYDAWRDYLFSTSRTGWDGTTDTTHPYFNVYDFFDKYWIRAKSLADGMNQSNNTWGFTNIITHAIVALVITNDIAIGSHAINSWAGDPALTFNDPGTVTLLDLDTVVEDAAADFGDELDRQIDEDVLPRFRRGMQEINSVMSSAFVIGEAIILEGRNQQVARFTSDLKAKATIDGRRLDYENNNRYRELTQAEYHHRRSSLLDEKKDYRQLELSEVMDRRRLMFQRDSDYNKMVVEEKAKERELKFQEADRRRELVNQQETARADVYVKNGISQRTLVSSNLSTLVSSQVQALISGTDIHLKQVDLEQRWKQLMYSVTADAYRTKITAGVDQQNTIATLMEERSLWKINLSTHAANLLAGPSGGTSGKNKSSKTQSALSGGIGGAALGASAAWMAGEAGMLASTFMASNPVGWGVGIGAAVGVAAGLI